MTKSYDELRDDVESVILPICALRQNNYALSYGDFKKTCLSQEQRKMLLEKVTTPIVEYLYAASNYKDMLDGMELTDAFDECLKSYTFCGGSFLNMFINRYELKIRHVRMRTGAVLRNRDGYVENMDDYVDKKLVSQYGTAFGASKIIAESLDRPLRNAEGIDAEKASVGDFVEDRRESANPDKTEGDILEELCRRAFSELKGKRPSGTEKFLPGYLAVNALLGDLDLNDQIHSRIDLNFFQKQDTMKETYRCEYEKIIAQGGRRHEKAFYRENYLRALADEYGLQIDTLRKRHNLIQSVMTEIGEKMHLLR